MQIDLNSKITANYLNNFLHGNDSSTTESQESGLTSEDRVDIEGLSSPDKGASQETAVVNNTAPDKKLIKNAKGAAVGSIFGSTTGAGVGLVTGGVSGAFIGGAVGGAVGAVVGNNIESILFDVKAVNRWAQNLGEAVGGKIRHAADELSVRAKKFLHKNEIANFSYPTPLDLKYLKAVDKTGEIKRKYDGYDSSRDIFALYAKEGNSDEKYSFSVEMANLRAGAEYGNLDVYMLVDWGASEKNQDLPFNLQDKDGGAGYKMVVKVGGGLDNQIVDKDGNTIGEPRGVYFSTSFSNAQFQIEKEDLKKLGWKEGEPLNIQVMTAKDGENDVVDRVSTNTGVENQEHLMKDIFRWEGKTIYYAVTDRFNNGDKTNDFNKNLNNPEGYHGGDWQGIIDKVDYMKDLGFDATWISCPYENDKNFFNKDGFHGYWPHNFFEAEPNFGTKEKLKELVDTAHSKDMKVIFDVVINHTGYNHPYTKDPAYKDWYHKEGDLRGLGQYHMENAALAGLPDLDQDNPEVVKHLTDAHKMWLNETGADGFRMDAVRHTPEDFLRTFVEDMHETGVEERKETDKETSGEKIFVGEAFWLDPNFVAGYQNRTMDSLFDFYTAYTIRDVFAFDKDRTLMDRLKMAKRFFMNNPTETLRELFAPMNGGSMYRMSMAMQADALYDNPKKMATLIDNHDMIRFMTDTGGDKRQLEQALAFMFSYRGIPAMYYGTENAEAGAAGENRNDMVFGKDPEMAQKIKNFNQARKSSYAMQYGSQQELHVGSHTYAFSRMRPEEEVICAFNNSEEEKTINVKMAPESQIQDGDTLKDMLSDYKVNIKDNKAQISLPPRGYVYMQWKK